MSFKTDLYAYLSGGELTNTATGGIHPGVAPQGTALPYITWSRIGDAPYHHSTGASALSEATFQFDCWAATALSLDQVAEALREELDGFAGPVGDSTDIRRINVENETDGLEYPEDGREAAIYRSTFTVTVWYARAAPVR